ncbi:PrsW family glutamic-type intramembrane protease [Bengtsoniella intestinalis]|uniref:PrsW family glutamic-type intramembrane protease n=1 Tax=Bengtsoniella intestinalis TaxID=3073143 RepID=UPI00391F1B95
MIYVENIYLCLVAPLLVACCCSEKANRKALLFLLLGMSTCLLSAYVNMFIAQVYGTTILTATIEITPLIEEVMKLLPILFYLLIFQPKIKEATSAMLMIAVGFATFENICYLVEHGADNLTYLLMRGFGTGAMHIVCGAVVGYGLLFTWEDKWLKLLGTFGVLCLAITFHAQFNLLMSGGTVAQLLGTAFPLVCMVGLSLARRKSRI